MIRSSHSGFTTKLNKLIKWSLFILVSLFSYLQFVSKIWHKHIYNIDLYPCQPFIHFSISQNKFSPIGASARRVHTHLCVPDCPYLQSTFLTSICHSVLMVTFYRASDLSSISCSVSLSALPCNPLARPPLTLTFISTICLYSGFIDNILRGRVK